MQIEILVNFTSENELKTKVSFFSQKPHSIQQLCLRVMSPQASKQTSKSKFFIDYGRSTAVDKINKYSWTIHTATSTLTNQSL